MSSPSQGSQAQVTESHTPALADDPNKPRFLNHPYGLYLLFMVEMWERFSYYGMRGLLVLYLVTIFAAKQLPPGVYSNEFEIREVQKVEPSPQSSSGEKTEPPMLTHRRTLSIVMGTGEAAPAADVPAPGGALKVERLRDTGKKDKEDNEIWDVDTDAASPIVLRGQPGQAFGDKQKEVRYRITNPSDKAVSVQLELKPDTKHNHTYFTINDNPTLVAAEIKPDAEIKATPDAKPFEVRLTLNEHDSGRNWSKSSASTLYGWYTGLAYLFPILGGILADKLIGTHRSMLIGGVLIALGHIILGVSGMGDMAYNQTGMSVFVFGLAVIVLGTGHFKPTVSVMVGQLYSQHDSRRDGAFTIFYMGINLGAFLCAFVCGTLGEQVGWHYGFGAAAIGMLLGLFMYMLGKPHFLPGIGDAPVSGGAATAYSTMLLIGSLGAAAAFGAAYHYGAMDALQQGVEYIKANPLLNYAVMGGLTGIILGWVGWFLMINKPEDRGPVLSIFIFMFFNAFFWIAFEQAGSSINVFTEANTNRMIGSFEVPATWFQSVNAGLIFLLAPLFAGIWVALGKQNMNPSQPVKIALGLIFLGIGYIFMVIAGQITVGGAAKASMFFVLMTYFWHTVGELCLSPTGLSFVTKAAPARFVSLLMGIWFVSSFIANLGGGIIASYVEDIEKGAWQPLPIKFGGQADFFAIFVVTSLGAGLVIWIFSAPLKKLIGGRE